MNFLWIYYNLLAILHMNLLQTSNKRLKSSLRYFYRLHKTFFSKLLTNSLKTSCELSQGRSALLRILCIVKVTPKEFWSYDCLKMFREYLPQFQFDISCSENLLQFHKNFIFPSLMFGLNKLECLSQQLFSSQPCNGRHNTQHYDTQQNDIQLNDTQH